MLVIPHHIIPASAVAKPVTYEDLGGIEEVLSDIRELIEYPLKHPEVSQIDCMRLVRSDMLTELQAFRSIIYNVYWRSD